MKRLAILLLLPWAGAWALQDCELNGESVNPANGHTTAGKTGIMACRDRDSRQLMREEEIRAGVFIGIKRQYRDGRKEKEYSINEKGNIDGQLREYSLQTGQVIKEEMYRNGTQVGLGRSFYPDGRLKKISYRSEDGKEAAALEYTPDGKLRDIRCGNKPYFGKDADDTSLCGHRNRLVETEIYDDRGNRRGKLAFLNGQQTGGEWYWGNGLLRERLEITPQARISSSYSVEGKPLRETRLIPGPRGPVKELEREYHETGTPSRERRWQDGEQTLEKTYYMNGQPKSEIRFKRRDGELLQEVAEYHDNGQPSFKGSYLARGAYNRKPMDLHQFLDRSGRIQRELSHDAQGRLQREREFDEGGRLIRDDEVFPDGSRKSTSIAPR